MVRRDCRKWLRMRQVMSFAFLTASPWKWQLVAPYEGNPGGLVNVTTGETHAIAW
jgi:adenine deaminase